ncbi:hypothetical protein HPT27_03135 [Permianibacter sp. IMCC34836]|uniref:DUF6988 family protein n=1 Tax=Permianibacter fluminis TaxID=2738515 RepID=UPI0015581F2E|nr:hypothetical protein [Permianibacter fluminis]NQD36002.1 hypothetical protein [Permianibacter fluminis]
MDIETMLQRSLELERALVNLIETVPPATNKRAVVVRNLCKLSFEHGNSTRLLIAHQNLISAIALIRLQYESIARAVWVLYAAAEHWVDLLNSDLTQESDEEANKLPSLQKMLNALPGVAGNNELIKELLRMLDEFKRSAWKQLSSFAHGGIHAIRRSENGLPRPLLEEAIKMSNGLLIMVGIVMVVLSRDSRLYGSVPAIQRDFRECLPPEILATSKQESS